jgi:hypothetical protein
MLMQMEIRSAASPSALARATGAIGRVFPDLPVAGRHAASDDVVATITRHAPDLIEVPARCWRADDLDLFVVDQAVAEALAAAGRFSLRLVDEPAGDGDLTDTAVQLVTRCQRHLRGRNHHSATPLFDAILDRHRALHDLSRPLVAADHDHALDTWRWVLRLDPDASAAVQLAALFHDVERLISESEVRIEQHAPDYVAFKDAHAAAGAAMTAALLADEGAEPALVARVAALVATHEHPGDDAERALLNEADALSFFSLNAPGFARYYGPAHTARKVAYTLARLGPRGRRALAGIRHRADIAALIASAGGMA